MELEQVPAHEATVVELLGSPGLVVVTFTIEIEPTPTGFSKGERITLTFPNAADLTRDREAVATYAMEAGDGELLSIAYAGHCGEILVEWCEYEPTRRTTRFYRFSSEAPVVRRDTADDRAGRAATGRFPVIRPHPETGL